MGLTQAVVSDSTALISLLNIEKFELLFKFAKTIIITRAVYDEVAYQSHAKKALDGYIKKNQVIVKNIDENESLKLLLILSTKAIAVIRRLKSCNQQHHNNYKARIILSTMKILLLTLFSILISACSDNLQIQTSNLEIAKTKWSKVNANHSYSYSYKRNCFCVFSGENIKVNIKDDKVFSATSDGIELSTVSFLTINEHFTQISDFLKEKEEGSLFIEVEYDAKYGYPTTISTESIPFALAEVVKETIYDISFYNKKGGVSWANDMTLIDIPSDLK